jgi:hypothetical protein
VRKIDSIKYALFEGISEFKEILLSIIKGSIMVVGFFEVIAFPIAGLTGYIFTLRFPQAFSFESLKYMEYVLIGTGLWLAASIVVGISMVFVYLPARFLVRCYKEHRNIQLKKDEDMIYYDN